MSVVVGLLRADLILLECGISRPICRVAIVAMGAKSLRSARATRTTSLTHRSLERGNGAAAPKRDDGAAVSLRVGYRARTRFERTELTLRPDALRVLTTNRYSPLASCIRSERTPGRWTADVVTPTILPLRSIRRASTT